MSFLSMDDVLYVVFLRRATAAQQHDDEDMEQQEDMIATEDHQDQGPMAGRTAAGIDAITDSNDDRESNQDFDGENHHEERVANEPDSVQDDENHK